MLDPAGVRKDGRQGGLRSLVPHDVVDGLDDAPAKVHDGLMKKTPQDLLSLSVNLLQFWVVQREVLPYDDRPERVQDGDGDGRVEAEELSEGGVSMIWRD